MATIAFTKIPAPALPRSSHTLSLIDGFAYIFGGEIQPRVPVDNSVHRINVQTGAYEVIQGTGDAPSPRVGHAAATLGGDLYIFGGRGGADMAALEEHGAIYRFSPPTSTWTRLSPPVEKPYPAGRSYHCSTATASHILVHAGCAKGGRLNDLWAFDVCTFVWTRLADAPGDPRGGSAIAYLPEKGSGEGKVYRLGGFNGKTEVGGGIDVFTLTSSLAASAEGKGAGIGGEWETIPYDAAAGLGRGETGTLDTSEGGAGPGARSVTALLPLRGKLVAVMGEGKPSPTGGHDAAGNFWDDVWSFAPNSDGAAEGKWTRVDIEGPEARGWFAADSDGERVVLWGGLNGANERLTDGWVLA